MSERADAFSMFPMGIAPATEADLLVVKQARKDFCAHWQSFPNMPFGCDFTGTLDDVRALDYLEYEGLGHPVAGKGTADLRRWNIDGAALVWGNVLAHELNLTWMVNVDGALLLTHDVSDHRITVWPYARVLEAHERSFPQFNRYDWLLKTVARDFLENGDLSETAREWVRRVLKQGDARV